jgi:capsid portal protein
MIPSRYDHDKALAACYRIKSHEEMANELLILNQVLGAYACNEHGMCAHISRHEFNEIIKRTER